MEGKEIKEFLINNLLSEYKDSLEIQIGVIEKKLRDKLEKKTPVDLASLRIIVEVNARIVPK
ncbi:hypothetical protein [Candidatus Borrarchaeum sp.]|uniref:hypothetical protein n=1 Tax=Candidatus Borrarchaeum sp. TaxID=2846742 RepID=UPI00257B9E14|nr:hypothetical protein [Candidatus Borrarchaeum sp.]